MAAFCIRQKRALNDLAGVIFMRRRRGGLCENGLGCDGKRDKGPGRRGRGRANGKEEWVFVSGGTKDSLWIEGRQT